MANISPNANKRKLSPQRNDKKRYYNNRKRIVCDSEMMTVIENLFSKRFEITNNDKYTLPRAESMFTGSAWQIDKLQELKQQLNKTKSKLNNIALKEWQYHTKKRNKAGDVQWKIRKEIDPEFLTQAWTKFYENVSTFALVPEKCLEEKIFNSLHLCEAPGAFITSLNHYLKSNAPEIVWKWMATTLNPHYEGNTLATMVNDDRFILHTDDHWFFGSDCTGNIMKLNTLDEVIQRAQTMGDIMLVTADGSINCTHMPDEQEAIVVHLHYCETIAALHILSPGGSFLLKIFTIFEQQTICLMYLLTCCFNKIILNKPVTSKEGNSEIYVVCLEFKGEKYVKPHLEIFRKYYEEESHIPIFLKEHIPDCFINQIILGGDFFREHQCCVIESNIETFHNTDEDYEIKKIRRVVADHFIETYQLRKLEDGMEIVGKKQMEMSTCQVMGSKYAGESYNERKKRQDIDRRAQLQLIIEDIGHIDLKEDFAEFKLSDRPIPPLRIVLGKPFEVIQSSRFCIANILKSFNSAFDIIQKLGIDIECPEEAEKQKFEAKMANKGIRPCNFQYSLKMDFSIVENMCRMIESIEEGETIALVEYCLLTQLNVGIFWLLAHAFESVEMDFNDEIGSVIYLKNLRHKGKLTELLKNIHERMMIAEQINKVVVSIFRIADLCAGDLYSKILQMNQRTIRYYIHQISKKMNVLPLLDDEMNL